jgi:hypothetical protein
MMELSRASGPKAAIVLLQSRAHRSANRAIPEARNQPPRRTANRLCAWAGSLALLALAGVGAHAQQQTPTAPIGDIYDSGGGAPPAYSDIFESKCQNTSIYKGMNPLVCYGFTGSPDLSGKCSNTGPTVTLWKQEGRLCIYCQHLNPPLTDGFVVPFDDLKATESQGFKCGVDQTDPNCSVVCYGPGGAGKFRPPPGTERVPSSDNPEQPTPAQKTPRPPVMAKKTAGSTPGTASPRCDTLKPASQLPKFTSLQLAALTRDLAAAKAMVAKAKTYTDKIPWDSRTQAISNKYFGNATTETQATIRQNVTNVLALLNGIKSITGTFYPGGADETGEPAESEDIAYTEADNNNSPIFLTSLFWDQLPAGPNSQPAILVHEISHLPAGGATFDFRYGENKCLDLVFEATHPLGNLLNEPWQEEPMPANAPAANADNFMYFVYYVANQASQK